MILLCHQCRGMAGEFRQMNNRVEMIKVEQGEITRKVGEMRAGVAGQEVKDIVRRVEMSP